MGSFCIKNQSFFSFYYIETSNRLTWHLRFLGQLRSIGIKYRVALKVLFAVFYLVVTSAKLLVVSVGFGVWSPPEYGGSDIISHGDSSLPVGLFSTLNTL